MMDSSKAIRIKILLLARGLSQTELARRMGVSVSYVNMVIHGKKKAIGARKKLAKQLGMSLEELFGKA